MDSLVRSYPHPSRVMRAVKKLWVRSILDLRGEQVVLPTTTEGKT
jgi:hypothetical protein